MWSVEHRLVRAVDEARRDQPATRRPRRFAITATRLYVALCGATHLLLLLLPQLRGLPQHLERAAHVAADGRDLARRKLDCRVGKDGGQALEAVAHDVAYLVCRVRPEHHLGLAQPAAPRSNCFAELTA